MPVISVKYGKYLNEMTNSIPSSHIMIQKTGAISRQMEPGKPNLPSPEYFDVVLANLDPLGLERYPLSFWQDQSRTQAEGAFQELQIYFEIKFDDQVEFVGIVKRISFSLYNAECTLQLGDLLDVIRTEKRRMLRSFEFSNLTPESIDTPGVGENDLPTLLDLNGDEIEHEAMTFFLASSQFSSSQDSTPTLDMRLNDKNDRLSGLVPFEFAFHMGWDDLDNIPPVRDNDEAVLAEITRPIYVQIDDFTILTRCRLWVRQKTNDVGSRYQQQLFCTIWHNAQPIVNQIPIGRFLSDKEVITEDTEDITIQFHLPDFGFSDETAMHESFLPDGDMIFGIPYKTQGSDIQLTSEAFAYFDVIEVNTQIINTDFSNRHTSLGLTGSLTITKGANSAGSAVKATTTITPSQQPFSEETIYIEVRESTTLTPAGRLYHSQSFDVLTDPADTLDNIAVKATNAFNANGGNTDEAWVAVKNGLDVDIEALLSGEDWNGFTVSVLDIETHQPSITQWTFDNPTGGGVDGDFVAAGIDVYIGGVLFTTTADLTSEETISSIVTKLMTALNGEGSVIYSFEQDGDTINVSSTKQIVEGITLDVKTTGVEYESQSISGAYQLFDFSHLRDVNRNAFFSDVAMFGWVDKTLIECLVGCVWQVSAVMFTNKDGKIAIQNRDWHLFNLLDTSSPSFDGIIVPDEDWEPLTGETYEEGFRSYQTTHPVDIIEVNNVVSNGRQTIFADKNGLVTKPSLKNESVQISNFRISDLSVISVGLQLRYSPDNALWPNPETLDNFLPLPETILKIIAATYFFPNPSTRIRVFYPDFTDIDVGQYILDDDNKLWLITGVNIDFGTETVTCDLQFKKQLTTFESELVDGMAVGDIFTFENVTPET